MKKTKKIIIILSFLVISFFVLAETLFLGLIGVNAAVISNGKDEPSQQFSDVATYNSSYYTSVNSLKGDDLLEGLAALSNSRHRYYTKYDEIWGGACYSDADPKNPGYILDFYTQASIPNTYNYNFWNREHVWCQNLSGNTYGETGAGADIHHIRPSIKSINSSRSDSKFGDNGKTKARYYSFSENTVTGTSSSDTLYGYTQTGVFEPIDSVKGDAARIIMYVYMHYSNEVSANSANKYAGNLVITNVIYADSEQEAWNLLIEWNESDPVDTFEMDRNNYCASVTGLRNPFIDHPEYAEYIWSEEYASEDKPKEDESGNSTPSSPNIEGGIPTIPTDPIITYKPVRTTYKYTFTSKVYSKEESITLGTKKWRVTGELNYDNSIELTSSDFGYDSTKGHRFGSGDRQFTTLNFTVTTEFKDITSIYITTSGGAGTITRMKADLGDLYLGERFLTSESKTFMFTPGGASGRVSFLFEQLKSKGDATDIYIKEIEIHYNEYVEEKHYCDFSGDYLSDENGHWLACVSCGRLTEVKGHVFTYSTIQPATCYDGEILQGLCFCGVQHIKNGIDALGHKEVIDEEIPATCINPGKTQGSHCERCELVFLQQNEIAPFGHSYSKTVIAPTCTQEGYTAHTCSTCAHTYHDTYKAALGHKYSSKVTKPTCNEKGYTTHTCSRCSDVYKDTYTDALGHNYVAKVTNPKCEERGYTTHTCSRCQDAYIDSYVSAKGHTVVSIAGKAATCTTTGLTQGSKCSVCRKILKEQETIPTLAHTYTSKVTAPTCLEEGYTTHTCSGCKRTYVDTYKSALGHNNVVDKAVAATCIETGLTEGSHCSVCKTVTKAQTTVDALGHNYSNKVTAPTCLEKGYTTHTCSRCNDTYEDLYVDALGHSYISTVYNPKCEERGYTTYTCTECSDTYIDNYVTALGHTTVIDKAVAATCIETGLTEGSHCLECNKILLSQTLIPALGHNVEIDKAVAATCIETGLTEGSHCLTCEAILVPQEVVDALGHNYLKDVTNPSCTLGGYTTHTCSRCSDSYVDTYVDSLGHIVITDKKVSATCTKTGLTEGSHCLVCSEILVAQLLIPALGHNEVIDKAINPTCIETGLTEGSHCLVCEAILVPQEVVDALGHNYLKDVINPSCTLGGYTIHTCSRCSDTYVDSYIDALGHNEIIVEGKTPTCTKTGLSNWKYCLTCEEILVAQSVIPALGHTAVIDKAVAATCTEPGLTEGAHCLVCLEVLLEQEETLPLGHNYKNEITKPTCTLEGYIAHICSKCSDTYVDTYVDSLGHTEVTDEAVAPTCTEPGLTEGSHCSVCNITIKAQTKVDALGHDYSSEITKPTCTLDGYTTHICTECSDTYINNYVNALGHTEVIVDGKAATCTTAGLTRSSYCLICETILVSQEVIEALGHNYLNEVTKPTCTLGGYTTHTCLECNDTFVDTYVDSLGHTAVIDKAINPTCIEAGLTEGSHCLLCSQELVKQEIIDALGHAYTSKITSPTCLEKGYTTHTCSRCSDAYKDLYVDALGHSYISTVYDPTCVLKGCTTHTCINCSDWYIDTYVDSLGHTEVDVLGTSATCTEDGITDGKQCEVCLEFTVPQTKIPALGHDVVIVEGKLATCTESGLTEGSHCSVCETILVLQEVVEALGHNYLNEVTKPTCTLGGYTTHTCLECNDTFVDTYVDSLGHTEVIDKATDPTCTEPGLTEGAHCSVCSEVLLKQEEMSPLGHNYESEITKPTCTLEGYTTHTCINCSDSYIDTYVDSLGHTEVDVLGTLATCTEDGITDGLQCEVCLEFTVAQTKIPALGHDVVIVEGKLATCTEDGLSNWEYCSVCEETLVEQTIIPALGHTVVTDHKVPATCTKTGLTEGSHCSICLEVFVPQEEIPLLDHNMSNEYKYDDKFHWKECSCGTIDEKVAHSGGVATETEQAVCDLCKQPYGELIQPEISNSNVDEQESAGYEKYILPSILGFGALVGIAVILLRKRLFI